MKRLRHGALCFVLVGLASALSRSDVPRSSRAELPFAFAETDTMPQVEGRPGGTFRLITVEPQAIDPSNTFDTNDLQVASYLFTGLVNVARDGMVSAGVATRWTPNSDCSQWTFELRKATRFHNGEEVTSASFKRGWDRAATSDMAYLLEPVQHVNTANPYVLTVTLNRADCTFPRRLVQPVFSPVPTNAGPSNNQRYNDEPIGNGPFQMDGPWRHNRDIRLIRYEGYQLEPKPNLAAVDITISVDPAIDGYQGFHAGLTDWTRLTRTNRDEARSIYQPQGKVISKHGNRTLYLLAMVTTKPLDSPAARRAISLAIDRDTIARNVFHNGNLTATSLTPPGLSQAFRQGVCDDCRFDPAEAKRLAASAGLTPDTVLHFRYNDWSDQEKWTAAIKQQLEATLGLRVNYFNLPFEQMLADERAPGASGIARGSWGPDYPSVGDMLEPILTSSAIGTTDPVQPVPGDNHGRYSNPRVDQLLSRARATLDEDARDDLYRQAERIAIGEDLALIPLWYYQEDRLANTDRFANLRLDWHENADLSLITLR